MPEPPAGVGPIPPGPLGAVWIAASFTLPIGWSFGEEHSMLPVW